MRWNFPFPAEFLSVIPSDDNLYFSDVSVSLHSPFFSKSQPKIKSKVKLTPNLNVKYINISVHQSKTKLAMCKNRMQITGNLRESDSKSVF